MGLIVPSKNDMSKPKVAVQLGVVLFRWMGRPSDTFPALRKLVVPGALSTGGWFAASIKSRCIHRRMEERPNKMHGASALGGYTKPKLGAQNL